MEFIGTFFFVFVIAMGGHAFAAAAMLMAWVYIGSLISGGHFNPAVSLAVAMRGKLAWDKLAGYMIAQICGGIAAYLLTYYIHGQVMVPEPMVHLLPAFIVEVLLASVLALVVLVVTTTQKLSGHNTFGLAIGFTIPALAAIGKTTSGGLFNPAIAFGASIVGAVLGGHVVLGHLVMYVLGALLGGALASYLFHYFGMENK